MIPRWFLTVSLVILVPALALAGEVEEAFYIEPMELQMAPAKRTAEINVVNKEEHKLRIRVDVFERTDNIDGSERRVLSTDLKPDVQEFDLMPGSSRHIKLAYKGSKKIAKERAYRVVVKQVMTSPDAAGNSLDLRFIYIASVFVTPVEARAKLVIDAVRRTSDRTVEVELSNEGRAHQKMKQIRTVVVEEDMSDRTSRELELSDESIEMLARQNLLSGGRRVFKLELNNREGEIAVNARLRVKFRAAHERPPASN